ncbi:MAG: cytidylate kinase [Flavobacteriales bacterium]|nr:cytidylate kinase [Flavobacteriales bacterium]|tara:strand:+ start:15859 stop:16548 length:690 start_codon:yes stop_codon:yes gene_type:complete
MSLPFNIAIDGHSSCGKSTIAKSIANKYGMRYIDTGAMYRAITLYCMRHDIINNQLVQSDKLFKSLNDVSIAFEFNTITGESETILNTENVEDLIRGIEVSDNVSIIAQIKQVRDKLIILQQEIGRSKNVVMDGRDIGTKVFPDAKLKLFVTARPEIRAKRRYDELIQKGNDVSFYEILKSLNSRDAHDISRAINPLLRAKDAVLIDNSDLSIKDQNILIENLINNKKS